MTSNQFPQQPDFTDETVMPFGKHKGKKMANVPAPYLLYLYNQPDFNHRQVKKYVENNLDALKKEAGKSKR